MIYELRSGNKESAKVLARIECGDDVQLRDAFLLMARLFDFTDGNDVTIEGNGWRYIRAGDKNEN